MNDESVLRKEFFLFLIYNEQRQFNSKNTFATAELFYLLKNKIWELEFWVFMCDLLLNI